MAGVKRGMIGSRTHKSASLRLVEPTGLPEEMRDGVVELTAFVSTNPRKGHGTALMWQVCAEADRAGKVLLLMPDSEQLKRFYGRFGFVEVQAEPCLMARQAERPKIVRAA